MIDLLVSSLDETESASFKLAKRIWSSESLSNFADSHGMFLFAYNLQKPSVLFTFMTFSVQIGKIKV